ncbi:hypothetical protein M3Y98_00265000 [Aphelenchoides besseyi]|nr:hypothetical protein M3Y98_00265000 [Aphelenchoides besseyi]KAI6200898.1 hypothetical protein M3Y96_00783400 [Aphelenchoides besseyi]
MSNRKTTNVQKSSVNSHVLVSRDASQRQNLETQRNNVAYDNCRSNTANANDMYLRSHSNSSLSFNSNSSSRRNVGAGKAVDSQRNASGEVPLSQTNIYIRGLPSDFTAEHLNEMCTKFGRIVSTKAVLDPEGSRCRGYGFIDFESPQAATEALRTINSEGVYEVEMAKDIRARPNKHLEQDPTNLYIANLPPDYSENSIRHLLSPHGMVISTRVLRNADMTSRCVGFARMDSKESCDQIIAQYNGKKLDENCDPLVVKLADSGTRRPKHSTSSSGQSSDQTMCSSTWSGAQNARYAYPNTNYNDQTVSFSPVMPNGYSVYDPSTFPPTITGVPNVPTAIPMAMPYSNLVYQTNRQISIGSPGSNSAITNQVVYQPQFQQAVDYYGKPIYKAQNYAASSYYPSYSAYPSEYIAQQPYGTLNSAVYTTNPAVSEDECYTTYPDGSVANAVYIQSAYYPMVSQEMQQMVGSDTMIQSQMTDVPSGFEGESSENSADQVEQSGDENTEVESSNVTDDPVVSSDPITESTAEPADAIEKKVEVRSDSEDTRLNNFSTSS